MKKNRGYQYNFSEMLHRQMFDVRARERKAKTMIAVLSDFSGYFGAVVGIDIDELDTCFLHKK